MGRLGLAYTFFLTITGDATYRQSIKRGGANGVRGYKFPNPNIQPDHS